MMVSTNSLTSSSLHRYSYGYQNPARYWDPTGFASVKSEDLSVVRKDVSDYYVEQDGERIVRRLGQVLIFLSNLRTVPRARLSC